MKWFICVVFVFFISVDMSANNGDWGSTGHRTVGEIADQYLKRKTRKKISELLGAQSLALVSTFGDDIKSDNKYREFYTWHYVNMPFGVRYEDSEKNPDGDLVSGIEYCKKIITDQNSSPQEKAFYLKLLIHFIGDLHQPMHVGRAEDRGGNDVKLKWFGRETNLHSVWDSRMIEHFGMGYTELADNARPLSKAQVKALQQGSIADWVNDTQTYAIKTYASAEPGSELGYRYMYDHFHLVRSQLQKGGVRLAKVLNELFG